MGRRTLFNEIIEMQYILTQEEYNNLVPKNIYDNKCKEIEKLNRLVLKATKFKCIYDRTKEENEKNGYCFYCDDCPLVAAGTCRRNKEFSQ